MLESKSTDAEHAKAKPLDFSSLGTQCTPIAATEHRGITLEQLRQLVAFIDGQADENGFLPGWRDRKGQPCHKDRINLYDVVKYIVKPATEKEQCPEHISRIP